MKSSDLIFRFLIGLFFSLVVMLFDSFSWLGWFRGSIEIIFRPETKILSLADAGIGQLIASAKYLFSGPARIADLERRLAAAEREAISTARSREISENQPVSGWPAQVLSSGPQLIIEIPKNQFQNSTESGGASGDPRGTQRSWVGPQPSEDVGRGAGVPTGRWVGQDPNHKMSFETGSVVLSPDGALVGSIAAVGRFSARVKLLSDSGSQIPAAVLTPDKQKMAKGILTGAFGASLTLEKVLTEVELQPDLAVVTTGEDDMFPPDLLIGWIGKNTVKEVSSVYQQAEVIPAVKLAELKMVFIIDSRVK